MPLESPMDEAKRVLEEAKKREVVLKLIGGVAVCVKCPSAQKPRLARKYVDIDLVGYSKQGASVKKLFSDLGYAPREMFNAMYGDRRLIFNDPDHNRRVDVFLDVFEMCHTLNLRDRLGVDGWTIPPADLLFTKLQIVETNQKDYKDIVAILLDNEIGASDDGMINGKYLAKLCGSDWGVYKTLTMNLEKLSGAISDMELGEDVGVVDARSKELLKMIEAEPKTFSWKMRARIGERAVWYKLPEADKEVVDSRMPGTQGKPGA